MTPEATVKRGRARAGVGVGAAVMVSGTQIIERNTGMGVDRAPTTVMVTAAGSAPAVAVIQALRQQSEIPVRVVAADMDPLSVGFHLTPERALIPAASDPDFIPRVLQVCQQHDVTVLFPIIDEELQTFADHAPAFRESGIQVVTNAPETVRVAKDKWLTYLWCRRHGVRMPRTWTPAQREHSLSFPVMVKPRAGRGSVGVHLVRSERELEDELARGGDLIIQEYVEGPEFTVDILTDPEGRVLSAVPRERLMTKAGMCVKGRTVSRPQLLELSVHVAEAFPLTPRGNLQFKQSRRDGEYYLIEVNPKFGAGLPITIAAGVNMPLLLLKILQGERVAPMVGQFRSDLVMLRHWAEIFVAAEELLAPA
jgi:carbamoyl-phosphate synthase large subunit